VKARLFIVLLVLLVFVFDSTHAALAWGPLTHPIINKDAYGKASSVPFTQTNTNLSTYMDAGNGPDLVACRSIMTNSKTFEYAHNMFPHPFDGDPRFGTYMVKTSKDRSQRFNYADTIRAYGWTSHQLADQVAHYPREGYAESKKISFIPGWLRSRIGSTEHGIAEFAVDCTMFLKHPLTSIWTAVEYKPSLVHETAIKFYNNDLLNDSRLPGGYPPQKILNCPETKKWGRMQALSIGAQKALINMLLVNNPLAFSSLVAYYSDFDDDDPVSGNAYNHSVYQVQRFLENPNDVAYKYGKVQAEPKNLYASIKGKALIALQSVKSALSLGTQEAFAEDNSEEYDPAKDPFYYFMIKVGEEAESLGAIQVSEQVFDSNQYINGDETVRFNVELKSEELFRQAVENVINREIENPATDDSEFWAYFMKGMYEGRKTSFEAVIEDAVNAMIEDTTPPEISIVSPAEGAYVYGQPITVAYVVVDPESEVVNESAELNGHPVSNGEIVILNVLGENRLVVSATNEAGLTSTKTVDFSVGYKLGWVPPIRSDDDSSTASCTIQKGSTLPVKFTFYDYCGKAVTDSSLKVVVEGNEKSVTFLPGDGAEGIRWDPVEERYIVNLHAKRYAWIEAGRAYIIKVYAGCGGVSGGHLQGEADVAVTEGGKARGR